VILKVSKLTSFYGTLSNWNFCKVDHAISGCLTVFIFGYNCILKNKNDDDDEGALWC